MTTTQQQQNDDTEDEETYCDSERLRDLWPSLTPDVHRRIVDSEQDDPEWMTELTQEEREELRRESEKELEMMEREAKRRSGKRHLVDGWRERPLRPPR